MKEKKKISIGTVIFYMIPVCAAVAALFFGRLFARDYLEYKEAVDEYERIDSDYIKDDTGTSDYTDDDSQDDPARLTFFPDLNIDFKGLRNVNSDLACVLYIPVLKIQYPVVYSADNEEYLHRTFEGNYNSSGCIFYDYQSEKDFRGQHTFIFGHNMKNGSMFGRLKKFESDPDTASKHPYFYIYTDGKVRKYEIFSFYQTTSEGTTYQSFTDDKGYDKYISYCLGNSYFKGYRNRIDFSERPGIVTLSTCIGQAGGNERFVVHGALIAESVS
ncbi:class B sortase [Oribacterium sp. WCC10]|uniref:class B sortase n=1 Tax=Oribacterium sp. WCC10 TaxID=1855343 RepID=UPI0008F00CCE|nr:class B sortase [Oribacterium sp. WCC10]SFG18628.1 sortase B [Oribacterium sp. WCC10]